MPDLQEPERVERWRIDADIWLAKGGRARAVVRWSPELPGGGEPEPAAERAPCTRISVSNGERVCAWTDGDALYSLESLDEPLYVPWPLPELFVAFEAGPGRLPGAVDAGGRSWCKELAELPTVVIVDEPELDPTTWITLRRETGLVAGWCTMTPEAFGGQTLRMVALSVELADELPADPPAFEPPKSMGGMGPARVER